MPSVNIVLSDRGWILERLADAIVSRIHYVTLSNAEDPSADIQYYVTYGRRRTRCSPIELAFFSHLERDEGSRKKFFSAANSVDHCVCMSQIYEDTLRQNGIDRVTTISPGVDLDTFALKLRIGVVGRTYHTGRKGEHLVAQVMDIPEIEWHFTGEGWPGTARHLPEDKLADFYRDMDYILVPALYEGGPMCVVEALACGREVVSSAVGWVKDFPHISFENGNVDDLRRVLLELVETKRRLRASVLDRTWDAWADGHDRLFRQLLREFGRPMPVAVLRSNVKKNESVTLRRPALVLHGNEGKSLGGPSVRVPRTALELRRLGFDAEVLWSDGSDLSQNDLVHAFNVWNPDTALKLLHRANALEKPTVFSSIYLDLSERRYWQDKLPGIIAATEDAEVLDCLLEAHAEKLAQQRASRKQPPEPMPGYYSKIREMLQLCDHAIFLSEKEKEQLARLGAVPKASSIVRNPVDFKDYSTGNPELFAQTYGVRDYVLCVARMEPRKNQLMLLHALRDAKVPIVLVGHAPVSDYAKLVRDAAGPNVAIIERLSPSSDMLRSAYAGARVFVLPSWAEGAPLSALEAAASGAKLVLSDRSSEQEYFGQFARYCDPASPSSIREAVLAAYEIESTVDEVEAQKSYVMETYSWKHYAEDTAAVYQKAVEGRAAHATSQKSKPSSAPSIATRGVPQRLVFDLTTSAGHTGRWTGISRVEMALANALADLPDVKVTFAAWHNRRKQFIPIPQAILESGDLNGYVEHFGSTAAGLDETQIDGAPLIVCGSAWMQNSNYAAGVNSFARAQNLRLTPVICDIIPIKFPFWFDKGYTQIFEKNLQMLLAGADRVLAISKATRADVQDFYLEHEGSVLPVDTFELGDQIDVGGPEEDVIREAHPVLEKLQIASGDFVLSVGAIHLRKNHKTLYDTWLRLAEKLGRKTPHLVIVGGVAWNGNDLARAFREDQRISSIVHIVEGVSDRDLEWLYQNCLLTAYPSLYEGWGLPVAESLRYGKICLASNVSSMPEIAPNSTDLLDPLDITAWASRVIMYATNKAARAAREAEIATRYRPRTWRKAAEDFLGKLSAPVVQAKPKSLYRAGEIIDLGDPIAAARYCRGHWHLPEQWGSWSSGRSAAIEVTLTVPPADDLILAIECRSIAEPGDPLIVVPIVNDTPLGKWTMSSSQPGIFCARVPRELVAAEQRLTVVFESSDVIKIAAVKSSTNDTRRVGVGVSRLLLVDVADNPCLDDYFRDRPSAKTMLLPPMSVDLTQDQRAHCWLSQSGLVSHSWGAYEPGTLLTLTLPILGVPSDDVRLVLLVRGIVLDTKTQRVTVFANGTAVDQWQFNHCGIVRKELIISEDVFKKSSPLRIDLLSAYKSSPEKLKLGPEKEEFGIAVIALEIVGIGCITVDTNPLPALKAPTTVYFSKDNIEHSKRISLELDWHPMEIDGAWTRGRSGTLKFAFLGASEFAGSICLNVRCATSENEAIPINILLNDMRLGEWPVSSEWTQIELPLLKGSLHSSNVLEISIPYSQSPFVLGLGADARDIGVMIRSLTINPPSNAKYVSGANTDLPQKLGELCGSDLWEDSNTFPEAEYLNANPDVRQAVARKIFRSGHEHWLIHGREEKRQIER